MADDHDYYHTPSYPTSTPDNPYVYDDAEIRRLFDNHSRHLGGKGPMYSRSERHRYVGAHLFVQFLAHHDLLDQWAERIIGYDTKAGISDRARVDHIRSTISRAVTRSFRVLEGDIKDVKVGRYDMTWEQIAKQWEKVSADLSHRLRYTTQPASKQHRAESIFD